MHSLYVFYRVRNYPFVYIHSHIRMTIHTYVCISLVCLCEKNVYACMYVATYVRMYIILHYNCCVSKLHNTYGTAQFRLDVYMCVTRQISRATHKKIIKIYIYTRVTQQIYQVTIELHTICTSLSATCELHASTEQIC